MARTVQPPFVASQDIVELDADSKPVVDRAPAVPYERYIHGEIYRAHPGVQAIVHSHAQTVLPFTTVQDVPLRAVSHTCGFIGAGAPIFEIRDFAGDASNMLVDNSSLGEALARTLATNTLVLMRGHGFAVVGRTLQEVVYNAMHTVLNARVQMDALRLGRVTYLTGGESAAVSNLHSGVYDAYWQIWARQTAGELPCQGPS
jgi:HCOMODA/2-hydroxy-3-carboxy-muconic semialdehyde decarboxylase